VRKKILKRFLQPGFFEYGVNPVFSSATRTHDIYFPYAWSESDTIEIELPKNYTIDVADAPIPVEEKRKLASLNLMINIDKATNSINYKRKFYFGGGGNIYFPVNAYQSLKKLFDEFHKSDSHTITLKQN